MNFSCIFLLALALFGAMSNAYINSGVYSGVGGIGYNGVCGGAGYGVGGIGVGGVGVGTVGVGVGGIGTGYGAGYEGGYGCRTACGAAAVSDNCQCVKTIVRPVVERIPYSCARRVQATSCRSSCGLYNGGAYGNAGSGYLNGGYVY